MEIAYAAVSAVMTGLSLAGLLYGAWLSIRLGFAVRELKKIIAVAPDTV